MCYNLLVCVCFYYSHNLYISSFSSSATFLSYSPAIIIHFDMTIFLSLENILLIRILIILHGIVYRSKPAISPAIQPAISPAIQPLLHLVLKLCQLIKDNIYSIGEQVFFLKKREREREKYRYHKWNIIGIYESSLCHQCIPATSSYRTPASFILSFLC